MLYAKTVSPADPDSKRPAKDTMNIMNITISVRKLEQIQAAT